MEELEQAISRRVSPAAAPPLRIAEALKRLTKTHPLELLRGDLEVLESSRYSLHLGEHQVRLLLSLSKTSASASSENEVIGRLRASTARIISVWVRKRCLNAAIGGRTLQHIADAYCELLQQPVVSDFYVCEGILLLGSVCAAPGCPASARASAQASLVEELIIRKNAILKSPSLHEALAGVGCAITGSRDASLRSIVQALILLWTPSASDFCHEGANAAVRPSLPEARMVLRLFKFLSTWLSSVERSSVSGLDGIWDELVRGTNISPPPEVRIVKIMASAGLLQGTFARADSGRPVKASLENFITDCATQAARELSESTGKTLAQEELLQIPDQLMHQIRCLSVGVASCENLPADHNVMFCLARTLVQDVFDLSPLYSVLQHAAETKSKKRDISSLLVHRANFDDAWTLARAVCNQYRNMAAGYRQQLHSMFWKLILDLYEKHRGFSVTVGGIHDEVRKSHEAVFFSMVLLHSTALAETDEAGKRNLAPYVLDSFSCVEYLRNFSSPEYAEIIKTCVSLISESSAASSKLASLLPRPGAPSEGIYWYLDVIQTSRVVFDFRVLTFCLKKLDPNVFETKVAPTMFMFIFHPSKDVAHSAHEFFATFLISQNGKEQDSPLSEQLSVYYMNCVLEHYPDLVSSEDFFPVVLAMAANLPPGSAATVHCIDALVGKAAELFSKESTAADDPAHKLQKLLLRLVLLVDMQILPHLLKMLSKLILTLPSPAKKRKALQDAFAVVEASNDCTRKPILVPWLQSLAFVSKTSKMKSRL